MTTSRITDGHADFFSCTDGTPRQERLHGTALPHFTYCRSNYCVINRLDMLACVSVYVNSVHVHFNFVGSLSCPSGWKLNGRSCYGYMTRKTRFEWAEDDCSKQVPGGHLVSISSSSENDVVHNLTLTGNCSQTGVKYVWIGLNDRDNESIFLWTDDTNSSYRRWHENEPNNDEDNNGDCVRMVSSGDWRDGDCSDQRCYVCETASRSATPEAPTTAGMCTCVKTQLHACRCL